MPLIIFGCKNNELDQNYISQSINTLNMNKFSKDGQKIVFN